MMSYQTLQPCTLINITSQHLLTSSNMHVSTFLNNNNPHELTTCFCHMIVFSWGLNISQHFSTTTLVNSRHAFVTLFFCGKQHRQETTALLTTSLHALRTCFCTIMAEQLLLSRPSLMHSLGDVKHPGAGLPCHLSTCLNISQQQPS